MNSIERRQYNRLRKSNSLLALLIFILILILFSNYSTKKSLIFENEMKESQLDEKQSQLDSLNFLLSNLNKKTELSDSSLVQKKIDKTLVTSNTKKDTTKITKLNLDTNKLDTPKQIRIDSSSLSFEK